MNMVHQLTLMHKAMKEVRARTFSKALLFRYPQHADIVRYDQEAGGCVPMLFDQYRPGIDLGSK